MEKTLIILKPDCLTKKKAGTTLARFEDANLSIVACKMMQLTPELLREHYAHIADKPFFPEVEEFMGACPVIIAVLEGGNAIDRVRTLLGPTDSNKAPAGSIRGDFGQDMMRNMVHASDSPEAAAAEIARFFPEGGVYGS